MSTTTTENNFVIPESIESARNSVLNDSKFTTSYLNVIARSSKKLRETVQQAGLYALMFAYAHENYDQLTKLFKCVENNLSKSNAKQLKEWIEINSPAKLQKTKNGDSFRKAGGDSANPFNFENAIANPWYTIEMENQSNVDAMFAAMKMQGSIENLIKKAEKNLNEEKVPEQDIESVQAFVDGLRELKNRVPVSEAA